MEIIFRKDKNTDEIIAFFPETIRDGIMTCYSHIGQHSSADLRYYWETKKASPDEYQDLKTELETIVGYTNLTVKQKMKYK